MNRNQNRNRQQRGPQRPPKVDLIRRLKSSNPGSGTVFENGWKEFLQNLEKAREAPIAAAIAFMGVATTASSFYDLFAGNESFTSNPIFASMKETFPGRIALFIVLVTMVSVTISYLNTAFTAKKTETWLIIAHILNVIGALLLASWTTTIFHGDLSDKWVIVAAFTTAGLGLAVFLSKYQYKRTKELDFEVALKRVDLLFIYTAMLTLFFLFLILGYGK